MTALSGRFHCKTFLFPKKKKENNGYNYSRKRNEETPGVRLAIIACKWIPYCDLE